MLHEDVIINKLVDELENSGMYGRLNRRTRRHSLIAQNAPISLLAKTSCFVFQIYCGRKLGNYERIFERC